MLPVYRGSDPITISLHNWRRGLTPLRKCCVERNKTVMEPDPNLMKRWKLLMAVIPAV